MSDLVVGKDGGKKYDGAKPMWALLPLDVIEECVKVMTYGAARYKVGNWKKVEPYRYWNALFRHLTAYQRGEEVDSESGIHHLSHALCNIAFLLWFALRGHKQICDVPDEK